MGFISKNIDNDVNFDQINHKVYNSNGCMLKKNDLSKIDIGKYVSGWAKTGPHGILNKTILNAEETINNLRIHLDKNVLKEVNNDI
jgi:hypothetical protein